jgi:hypothetical protein
MVILIIVIGVIVLLGRYALAEGRRIENHKKFLNNMNNFDKNNSKKTN